MDISHELQRLNFSGVKSVPIDVSAHARVNQLGNRRKCVVSEMFYSYLRHYISSGVHHPAVAKHDDVQKRVRSPALKHIVKLPK